MSFTAFGPIYKATAALLPVRMDSIEAKAMMFAIPMIESRWDERRQIVRPGVFSPARGFPQFEMNGIRGVLNHHASGPLIKAVLDRLDYDHAPMTSHVAIEHNDVLALAYMRCLLWTVPEALPWRDNPSEGYRQYLLAWRPGKPQPRAKWDVFYEQAWALVTKGDLT